MKQLSILLVFWVLRMGIASAQQSCDAWQNRTPPTNSKPDTIILKAKFVGVENTLLDVYAVKNPDDFFVRLGKKLGLKFTLLLQLPGCTQTLGYPLIYQSKYDYKIFPRKNKQGKLVNWEPGQLLNVTCVRFNHFYGQTNEPVVIAIDIKALEGKLAIE